MDFSTDSHGSQHGTDVSYHGARVGSSSRPRPLPSVRAGATRGLGNSVRLQARFRETLDEGGFPCLGFA
jgi:hypothetical protein